MRLTLVLLAVASLAASQTERRAASLPLPTYRAEIERISAAFASAPAADDARAIAAALPDRWWVTSGVEVTTVDMSWIDKDIAAGFAATRPWPSVRAGIVARLGTMAAAAADPAIAGDRSPQAVLDSVLARPEFARSGTSRWLEEQRDRIGNWLLRLLERLAGAGLGSRGIAMIFVWVLSIVVLAALAFWLVASLRRRSNAASLQLGDAAPVRTPAREWALRALNAARSGDFREAVRCAYHAALCRFDEQGVWTVDDSRTPREYLSLVDSNDPRRSLLADLTRQFEQVWYGRRTPTSEDAQQMSVHLERLGCLRGSERAI